MTDRYLTTVLEEAERVAEQHDQVARSTEPGDQQAWTPEQRHGLTRHVDEESREAIEAYTSLPNDVEQIDKQRARYTALKAAHDPGARIRPRVHSCPRG